MAEVDAVLRELSDIQDRLIELPVDAFAERYKLRLRRDELRAQAAEFAQDWDAEQSSEDLLAELAAMKERLADAERQRIDVVSQSGGGGTEGPGASGLGGVSLNKAIDEAQGIGDIRVRIERIKDILIGRGVEVPH